MKSIPSYILQIPFKRIFATLAVFVALSATAIGTRSGLVSVEQLQRFWPLALVAVGLLDLMSWQERKDS